MEFMDRRGDMVKLQFWLLVEGFNSTDARDEKTFLQDVKMVYEMYFTDTAPHRLHIADQLNKDMKNAIQLADESSEEELFDDRVRELGLRLNRIQQHIFWEIEKEHFPYFKRSDLYFKFLASSPSLASNSIPEDIHAHKKTMPSNTSITNVGESPQPARRSLDENTLYRSSPIRPASATESTLDKSHLLLKEETDSKKADSDSEITTATILKRANESDTASSASVDSALPSPHSLSTPLNASGFGRFRGHQRALSDTSKPNTSRFLSFSNMFTWNGELRKPPPSTMSSTIKPMTAPSVIPTKSASAALPKKTGEPMKRATSSEKKKKRKETSGFEDDEDPLMIEEDEELDEEDDDEVEELLDSLKPKRNRLVRRNTVDAVEAELRSILDGSILDEPIVEEEIFDDGESTSSKKTIQKDTDAVNQQIRPDSSKKVAPKKGGLTSSSSVLLLSGSKGMKSTTAVPVQNPYTLPSWTSSGGTNTISEIEHDSLESIIGAKKAEKRADDDVKSMTSETSSSNVHFAPPGDLLLESKVQKLSEEVEKLIAQEAIVDALIEKAEKQDKLEELRILKKSKAIFRQELQQIKYQKSQYELQESENVLVPGRSRVSITSSTIGSDKHGDFALYVIEIQQLGVDGNYASGWIVARRYSEFFALHQKLKDHHPVVKLIEFPAKWPLLKLQKQFVEARRLSLEKYLRRLVEDKHICKSQELRAFLSQQNIYIPGPDTDWPFGSLFNFESSHSKKATAVDMQPSSSSSSLQSLTTPSVQNLQKSIQQASIDTTLPVNQDTNNKGFMRHIYKTVAAGIDDILIGPSMLDLITQRLSEQVTEFYQGSNDEMVSPPASTSSSKRLHDPPPEDVPAPPVADLPELKAEGITRFTEPLCDLFIEMFELKDKTNWLRRQAVVIILQQILEGTIER
jgi:sorting nexin-25